MAKKQEDGSLTVITTPLIPRLNGDGIYEVGDRVLALDVVHNEVRAGVVGAVTNHGPGKDFLIVTYGDAPFEEHFLCQRDDLRDDLPDPEDAEGLIAWLESGA